MWRSPSLKSPSALRALPDFIENIRVRALQGHVLEQVQWGQVLLNSIYVPQNPVQARQWFKIAADAGFGPAHNMYGRCYHFGWGCEADLVRAADCYACAAELGDAWGRYNLGIASMRGLGVPRDLARAFELFKKGAEAGHAKSMNLLARFTEEGWETPRNAEMARVWYRRSAETGDYRGQHNYATLLAEAGHLDEALQWWRRAVVDATSDILLAMRARLLAFGERADRPLLEKVEARLTAMHHEQKFRMTQGCENVAYDQA